ncbi:hypothetical protein [Nguyenibacter sp. L1]|uniref:hypothetical protein n=1 Tax=Nguyenibacter sp. L1 TaxID=3049350 RepID=UPI002B469F17|nr:hypothetical protein [Nguyenibacter sp. L1]WRH87216.1 hypothetical protein QN315_14715 [Nguyenibacter sp. L1]
MPPRLLPAFKPDWLAASALTERLLFVDATMLMHLSRGLTFDPLRSAEVLDNALCALDEKTGYVSQMQAWVRGGGLHNGECPTLPTGRIVVDVTEAMNAERKIIHSAAILNMEKEAGIAPVLFLSMVSPALDIGMRVEVPLRAVLLGNPPLENTYTVYLHSLLTSEGKELVYYGITKRGWNLRFNEHTRFAIAQKSRRLFARTLRDLITARADELFGVQDGKPKLRGLITTIIATGLSHAEALDVEEAMVDKYSLAAKHPNGLNMIPGGVAGLRRAASFRRKK